MIKTKKKQKNETIKKSIKNNLSTSLSTNYLQYPNNRKIIEVLEIFNKYYTIINNKIHQNSYQKAIYQLKRYSKEIQDAKDVKQIEGIGKGMLDKIDHILKTGTHPDIITKNMLEIINKNSNNLENLLGFGPSLVLQLNRKYGIKDIQDLNQKMNDTNPLNLPHIAFIGWKYHQDLVTPIQREEITQFGADFSKLITHNTQLKKYNLESELAGSYPSGKLSSKDIDLLIFYQNNNLPSSRSSKSSQQKKTLAEDANHIMEQIEKLLKDKYPVEIISKGPSKLMVLIKIHKNKPWRHVDIALYSQEYKPYAQLYFTSGKVFNLKIRNHAKKMGYKLSDTGLYSIKTGNKIHIKHPIIPNLFKKLNLDYKLYLTRY